MFNLSNILLRDKLQTVREKNKLLQKNIALYENKEDCCGCSACYSVCPVSAIQMFPDEEGFLYPIIDEAKCIGCQKCVKVCVFKNNIIADMSPKAYAARIKDNTELMSSSSGGMFTALSDQILEDGGAVVGAVYNYAKHCTELALITKRVMRDKARGSKYMQSLPGDIFKQSREWLVSNPDKNLIFFGMGCQTAGFKKYIETEGLSGRVYFIDIICHGVPSPKLWNDYITGKSKGKMVSYVTFKDKRYGWNTPFAFVRIDDTEVSLQDYVNIFYSKCALRPSCHVCPYASVRRNSDITIGDFWGIENVLPDFYDSSGNSLVLVHTDKGKSLMENCNSSIVKQEVLLKDCLQPNLVAPTQVSADRGEFWRHYRNSGIEYVVKSYGSSRQKGLFGKIVNKAMNILRKL